jgi:hypothetical protein
MYTFLQIFYRSSDNTLRSVWQDASGTWLGEQDLHGSLNSDLAGITLPDGITLQLFYRGSDNSLWSRWRNTDASWSSEQSLGGSLNGKPFVTYLPGSNIIQVFYRGSDYSLWSRWRNTDASWSSEQSLGGSLAGDPIAVPIPGSNFLGLFYQASDHSLCYRLRDPNTANWSGETALRAGLASDPVAIMLTSSNEILLLYRSTDGTLRSTSGTPGNWSHEQSLGVSLNGKPFVAPLPDNVVQVFYRGNDDNTLRTIWGSPGNWSSEHNLIHVLVSDPVAIPTPVSTGTLSVFYCANSDGSLHLIQGSQAGWSADGRVGGALIGDPLVTAIVAESPDDDEDDLDNDPADLDDEEDEEGDEDDDRKKKRSKVPPSSSAGWLPRPSSPPSPMIGNRGSEQRTVPTQGRLVIVGTGITAISQMTLETIGYIQRADVVFYHATNGVTATQIRELNPKAIDLYEYYGEGKRRGITYVEMAELMIREVRRGLTVVGVFYGHPGCFVSPARRALAIASLEGHETVMLAAVSSTDCMFSDLRIDPGVFGCQILMAGTVFQKDSIIAVTGNVVFLQVASVGDRAFSFSGYKNATLGPFFAKLLELYGGTQESVYYMAAVLPGFDPVIKVRWLSDYLDPAVQKSIKSGMLYLPPKGVSVSSLQSIQSFNAGVPYAEFESTVVEALDSHETPPQFRSRRASLPLYQAILELGTSARSRELYMRAPSEFVDRFPELDNGERRAIQSRSIGAVRAVTTVNR